jgi:hypothetical protein
VGEIVLHAGMGKTGTSSIQAWLAANRADLAALGTAVVRIRQRSAGAPVEVVEAGSGGVMSELVRDLHLVAQGKGGACSEAVVDDLLAALSEKAERHQRVVVTAESFQILFWRPHRALLTRLDELADVHRLRVAYYVRPQHTRWEAAWRQWGFRSGMSPSEYFLDQEATRCHYLRTLEAVTSMAPRVDFQMRPFRRDLLERGDVVADFAQHFLGIGETPGRDGRWANQGLPLDLVVHLSAFPTGELWESVHDNRTLDRLRDVVAHWDVPDSERALRSRAVLHRYCLDTYEAENRELATALGWRSNHFIPDIDLAPGSADLHELDELWSVDPMSPAVLLLRHALRDLVRPSLDEVQGQGDAGSNSAPTRSSALAPARVAPVRAALGRALSRKR